MGKFRYRAFRVSFSLFTALVVTYLFTTPEPGFPDTTGTALTFMCFFGVLVGMLRFTYILEQKGWWD